jgi:outer membrane receptor protein involved in Fe transport
MQFSPGFMRRCRLSWPHTIRFVSLLVVLSLLLKSYAQSTGGRVVGQVLDPTGAVVPGAAITLMNANAGTSQTSTSSRAGEYAFNQVPVGQYKLKVQLAGFKDFIADGIGVSLNATVSYDVRLEIGASAQVVEVEARPPLLDTTSTQLGAVINERAISTLPLNSRDTYQLLQLQPGVQGVGGSDLFYGSDKAGAVSVNGGRGRSNNFSVNGGDGNDLFVNSPGIEPSPDAVEEFRVITNTFDAEYGRNSGAVINVVTKSGTNGFHGSIYDYVRNRALDAKGYFDLTTPDDSQQQFGATIGGPIKRDKSFFFLSYEGRQLRKGITSDQVRVPNADERNGSFAGGFSGSASTGTVASILQNRPGCAAAISAGGGVVPDPSLVDQGNPVPWADVFPTGVIPPACFDPVAANLIQNYVPAANVGDSFYEAAPDEHNRENQGTLRLDHNFSDHNSLTGFYYVDDGYDANPFTRFQAVTPNLLPGFGSNNATRNQQINIADVWTINATSQNEARITYYREGQRTFLHPQRTNLVTNSCTGDAQTFCFNGNSDTPLYSYDGSGNATQIPNGPKLGITPGLSNDHEGVPNINISGGFTIGNDFEGELPQVGNTYSLTDNFSKTIGNHNLKFGADYRIQHFDQTLYYNVNGSFSFTGGGSNDLGGSNLFANYLLGLPDTYSEGSPQTENIRARALYLFAQDSYKLKSNLTINYGLRWELNQPLTDVSHRVQVYRPGQADTVFPCELSSDSQATLGATDADCGPGSDNESIFPLGLVVPGDKGVPAGLTQTFYKAFAPRIGLTWSPHAFGGKLVVRGGFGVFYNPMEQLVLEQFQGEPPFGGSSSVSEGLLQTPFVSQSGVQTPNPFNGFLNPKPGQAVDWSAFRPILLFGELQPNLKAQYTEQYNFGIQEQLGRNMVFNLGFVGSQGHRLLATYDLNYGDSQTCLDLNATLGPGTCGPFGEDSQYIIPADTPIAAQGLHLPYGSTPFLAANAPHGDINLVGLRKYSSPFCDPINNSNCPSDGVPVFSNIFAQDEVANSTYNSLQASLEKQFSGGLQFMGAYTFSKSIDNASSFEQSLDPTNFHRSRALSLFDSRHRFVFSGVWDLPFPKYGGGRGMLTNGWTASGIFAVQAGFPIRMQSNSDQELQGSVDFESPGKPNIVKPFKSHDPRKPLNGATGYYFDPSTFAYPDLGSTGNAPRSLCCGPGINNTDFALAKVTKLGESKTLEFTFQVFNIFNRTQFLNPDGQIDDAATDADGNPTVGGLFGLVTRTRDPRQIQLAIRFKM